MIGDWLLGIGNSWFAKRRVEWCVRADAIVFVFVKRSQLTAKRGGQARVWGAEERRLENNSGAAVWRREWIGSD